MTWTRWIRARRTEISKPKAEQARRWGGAKCCPNKGRAWAIQSFPETVCILGFVSRAVLWAAEQQILPKLTEQPLVSAICPICRRLLSHTELAEGHVLVCLLLLCEVRCFKLLIKDDFDGGRKAAEFCTSKRHTCIFILAWFCCGGAATDCWERCTCNFAALCHGCMNSGHSFYVSNSFSFIRVVSYRDFQASVSEFGRTDFAVVR